MSKEIEPQHCLVCGADSGTKIVCDACYPSLTKSQIQRLDHIFQRTVIEFYSNACVECGHSAETESGELCADHLSQKNTDPLARYDLANAVCRCLQHHEDRHAARIPRVPKKEKLPRQTQEKVEKHKKPAVCSVAGCPIWAYPEGKNPKHCWKHQ